MGLEPKLNAHSMLGGRYRIVSLIGQGGMGNVYLAEDLKLGGRRRAVKETLHRDAARFAREAEVLLKLSHPSLPDIVDYFAPGADGYGYIVMDYVEGETLAARFARAGYRMSVHEVLAIALQLCDIFQYLHGWRHGPIIYRDLKPSNIMMTEHGHVKLIDFGIARESWKPPSDETAYLGTPGFAAPEQFAGRSDTRTDLYHLGVLIHYLLSSGTIPEPDGNVEQLLAAPPKLRQIIGRLLSSDPEKRYGSAGQLAEELLALQRALPGGGKTETSRESGRAKLVVVGGLYRGCGSTFAAMFLASALAELGVHVCAAEYPAVEPSMHDRLQVCRLRSGGSGAEREPEWHWQEGRVHWQPAHPYGGSAADWDGQRAVGWAGGLPGDVAVLDISTCWGEPGVEALCARADLILIVACHQFRGWKRASAQQTLRRAERWKADGLPVAFVANRDVAFSGRRQWLRAFPWRPSLALPNIEYPRFVQAEWEGIPIWRDPHLLERTRDDVRRLCRDAGIPLPGNRGSRWRNRWRRTS